MKSNAGNFTLTNSKKAKIAFHITIFYVEKLVPGLILFEQLIFIFRLFNWIIARTFGCAPD